MTHPATSVDESAAAFATVAQRTVVLAAGPVDTVLASVAEQTTRRVGATLVIVALFLLSHPFTGIRHDGILYAGEALARLLPGEFHDDPYFLFGSQGRFTLMPQIYAWLIGALGLGTGTIVGMLAAFGAYLATTVWLLRWFAPSRFVVACALSVVLGWSIYGGFRIFAYAEPFLTARSFAEPANLFALGLLVRRRLAAAAVMLAIACAIHPLISIGGVLVASFYLVAQDRRWAWAAVAGGATFAACTAIGFGPFADAGMRFDAEWLEYVRSVNPQAFVLSWMPADFGVLLFNAVVLLFVCRLVDGDRRRFTIAVLVAALSALAASVLLVDVGHSAFVGKLQVSRTVWLMQWLAMASVPWVVAQLWPRGQHGRIAGLLLIVGWVAPFTLIPGIAAILALAIDTVGRRHALSAATARIVFVAAVLAAVVTAVQFEMRVLQVGWAQRQSAWQIAAQAGGLNLLLAAAGFAWFRWAARPGRLAPIVALVAFIIASAAWDQRTPWKHVLEASKPGAYLWSGKIEPGARVYWFHDLMAPWVLLGHANYYTDQQASGAVFSRDMVMELEKRQKVTAILEFQEQVCRMMNNLSESQGSCEPDVEAVRTACSEGKLDDVVLQSSLSGVAPLADYATGVTENGYEKKFFLYRCSALQPR